MQAAGERRYLFLVYAGRLDCEVIWCLILPNHVFFIANNKKFLAADLHILLLI